MCTFPSQEVFNVVVIRLLKHHRRHDENSVHVLTTGQCNVVLTPMEFYSSYTEAVVHQQIELY